MTKSGPLISIVIPVYNIEKYITKCLDTIIAQTYKNIEIICVNNNSTDKSMSILNAYGKRDSRIKAVTQENEGVSSARNKGLSLTNGEYIMFVDGDDWIELDTCEKALEAALAHRADVVFWPYIREFADGSKPKVIFTEPELVFNKQACKDKLHRRFIGLLDTEFGQIENADALAPVWGKLYKRDVVMQEDVVFVDLKKIGTSEDALFNFYVFNHVNRAVYINQYLSHYRRDNYSSITTVYKENLFAQWLALFALMEKNIQENNLDEAYGQALKNRVAFSILGLGINLLRSNLPAAKIRKEIKSILSHPTYRQAYQTLNLKHLPIYWKVFYFFAKHNLAAGVYSLLVCIQKIRGR